MCNTCCTSIDWCNSSSFACNRWFKLRNNSSVAGKELIVLVNNKNAWYQEESSSFKLKSVRSHSFLNFLIQSEFMVLIVNHVKSCVMSLSPGYFRSGLCNRSSWGCRGFCTADCIWWSIRQHHSVPEWGLPTPHAPPEDPPEATDWCPEIWTAMRTWQTHDRNMRDRSSRCPLIF